MTTIKTKVNNGQLPGCPHPNNREATSLLACEQALARSVRKLLPVAICALAVFPAGRATAQSLLAGDAGRQQLKGHLRAEVMGAPPVRRVPPETHMTLTVGLPLANRAALVQAAADIADPNSASFRHFLTPEQFADQFGASPADYQSLLDWAQSNHLTATTHRNRLAATVEGAVADIEPALGVHMIYRRRADGTEFFAPDAEPSVALKVPLEHIGGLDNFLQPEKAGGSASGGSYQGSDFRHAYAPGVTLTGKGQQIGIFMLDGFAQSDINGYAKQIGKSFLPVEVVPKATSLTPGEEGTLDIEAALSMAPAAQIVVFVGDQHTILANMADRPDIKQLSSSWFWYDGNSTDKALMLQFATQGQSFFQASGDAGAYWNTQFAACADGSTDDRAFPSITIVGGTDLNMSGSGASYGTLETVWSGSSGGYIECESLPSYQAGIAGQNGASLSYRNAPDVSAQANDIYIYWSGASTDIGGTSEATPLWAGFMALVNELAASNGKPSVGFANPALYSIASTSDYDKDFHDVVSGCAPGGKGANFCAGDGYDLVTGLGSPQAALISALSGVKPDVDSISPYEGPASGGTKVTIKGAGFIGVQKVKFGGVDGNKLTVVSDTELTVETPEAADSNVTVEVVTPIDNAKAASLYTYYPEIQGVSPSSGSAAGGTKVTVTGLALGNAARFEFGASGGPLAKNVTCSSSTKCTMESPAQAPGTVDIIALTPWGYGNSTLNSKDKFTYSSPSITSISPAVGPTTGGVLVTINGVSLIDGKTTVSFGGTVVTKVSCTLTGACTLTSPAHAAGSVSVTVTVDGITSPAAKSKFQFVVFPTVTGISAGSGKAGDTVTFTGTGFSTTPGQTTFTFSGASLNTAGSVSCSSSTKCTAVVPAQGSSTSVSITVTVDGNTSLDSVGFSYTTKPIIPPCTGMCN
jgi:hypothetical protein